MKTLFLFLGLVSAPALAGESKPVQYMVSAKISHDGKVMSNPKIANLAGEPSKIEVRDSEGTSRMEFEVITFEEADGMVRLNFRYKSLYGGDTVKFDAQTLVADGGEGALIQVEQPSGKMFEMVISAKRL